METQFCVVLCWFLILLGNAGWANGAPFWEVGPAFNLTHLAFDEGFSHLFGQGHMVRSADGRSVRLNLDPATGSGFISSSLYDQGFFSAKIKLPGGNTAGICVAFYTSNGDVHEKRHDEIDIEFLGGIPGEPWGFQTNIYGDGSINMGREERYTLWFDPTKDFHRYSIFWTKDTIIIYVDEVPIRRNTRNVEMGLDFPSKPMALYATIWDASSWATAGGKYKVDYNLAPFVAEFQELALEGCALDPATKTSPPDCKAKQELLLTRPFAAPSREQLHAMRSFRERHMFYCYCYDIQRYKKTLPECVIVPTEQALFNDNGQLKSGKPPPV